jgi:hypothetical protein
MTSTVRVKGEVTFENFDPNKQFENRPVWATFDGFQFKTHGSRGPALNAFAGPRRAKLYELTANGWKLRAVRDRQNRPTVCDCCGQTTMRVPRYASAAERNRGSYEWARQGNKILAPLKQHFVCPDCVGVQF